MATFWFVVGAERVTEPLEIESHLAASQQAKKLAEQYGCHVHVVEVNGFARIEHPTKRVEPLPSITTNMIYSILAVGAVAGVFIGFFIGKLAC